MATKRITIPVNEDIDAIHDRLLQDTGISMSYVQIINYLIHYYKKNKQVNTPQQVPQTTWAPVQK